MDRLIHWIPRNAVLTLGIALACVAAAVSQVVDLRTGEVQLHIDPSAERLLPEEDESRAYYDKIRRLFGTDETLVVALRSESVFSVESLQRVSRMTRALEAVDGVHHVLSITNAVNVRGVDDDLVIGPFMDEVPSGSAELESLRRDVMANPMYAGQLVSRDARTTALVVYFLDMSHGEYQSSGIDDRISEIVAAERGDAEAWITGGPHIRAVSARILLGETVTLPLYALAAISLVLLISFRSVRGVVIPALTIVVGVVWTFGLVMLLGYDLNAVTVLIPPLLTTLGLSYSVHVVAEYDALLREGTRARGAALVKEVLGRVSLPVSLTGLTTAAGFASLGLSPLGAVREFGLLAVIGVACSVVAALTFAPAALVIFARPGKMVESDSGGRGWIRFDRIAERIGRFDFDHRGVVFAASIAIFGLALFGVSEMKIGTQQVSKFRKDARVRVDFEAINTHLKGANLFFVVLETDVTDGFKEPENLRAMESLQRWLEAQPEIGGTTSLADYVKLVHRGFYNNASEAFVIPDTRRLTNQLLFFAGGDELDRFVDGTYQISSIRVRSTAIDSAEVAELTERIEKRLATLPNQLRGTVTGTSVVFNRALDDIIRGQAVSVLAALGIIYIILAALFVSFRIGVIALIPNVLPVAVYFGALGITGVLLSPGTSLVAPMVLGIAVDDTIHYFARFIQDAKRTGDERRATVMALQSVGRPVTYTTAALCLGFSTLQFSEIETQGQLGAMAAFALGFAWLTDFTLTPALCARLRIATLWDFLTIDLGPNPQKTITLFHGLTRAQARLVALTGRFLDVPAGERLFNMGEPGDSMYVVISGRCQVSIEQDGVTRQFATHGRGSILGEVGLFHAQRTADVDVVEDTRLLRFTQKSITHLGRRNPRVAAVVYSNLSESLAHHVAAAGKRRVLDAESHRERRAAFEESLARRGRTLDDAFFRKKADAYRAQLVGRAGDDRAAGSQVSNRLSGLGIRPDTLAALTLIPLVEVAWADGRMDENEQRAVLAGAEASGIVAGSPSHGLLRVWLDERPDTEMLAAWAEFIAAICEELSVEGRARLREAIVGRARDVAEAAGGFMGLGAISREEARVLETLEAAFRS